MRIHTHLHTHTQPSSFHTFSFVADETNIFAYFVLVSNEHGRSWRRRIHGPITAQGPLHGHRTNISGHCTEAIIGSNGRVFIVFLSPLKQSRSYGLIGGERVK